MHNVVDFTNIDQPMTTVDRYFKFELDRNWEHSVHMTIKLNEFTDNQDIIGQKFIESKIEP